MFTIDNKPYATMLTALDHRRIMLVTANDIGFKIIERCDDYFSVTVSPEQLRALGEELVALSHAHARQGDRYRTDNMNNESKQQARAEAWRTYAIHMETCGCGRGDRRCQRGNLLRDAAIVADGLATDGVHNTPHPSSCACRRCNAARDLAKHAKRTTTPDKISELGPDDVFTFGSNREGIHGKGAAKVAWERFGAVRGEGMGHHGRSYAIPTRELDGNRALLRTLALEDIATYVRDFLQYAAMCPELTFYVTKVGCGYAGYAEDEIAPLFAGAESMKNVVLPAEFLKILCQN